MKSYSKVVLEIKKSTMTKNSGGIKKWKNQSTRKKSVPGVSEHKIDFKKCEDKKR